MRMKPRIVFSAEEAPYVTRAAADCGLTVDQFCKAAVFYAIRQAYMEGSNEQAERNNTESGVSGGDPVDTQLGTAAGSAALPDETGAPSETNN